MTGHSPQRHMTAAALGGQQRRFQNFVQKYHGKSWLFWNLNWLEKSTDQGTTYEFGEERALCSLYYHKQR